VDFGVVWVVIFYYILFQKMTAALTQDTTQ